MLVQVMVGFISSGLGTFVIKIFFYITAVKLHEFTTMERQALF
jgi:hypothetical protein